MLVSHFQDPFQEKGRKKANKHNLFPEFTFSNGTICRSERSRVFFACVSGGDVASN